MSSYLSSLFNQKQSVINISAGETLLPCFFRKVSYTVCLFKTSKEALMLKLAGTGLKPALRFGHSYMIALGLVQYHDSDLGAYNEVILAIPSVPENMKPPLSNWMDLFGSLKNRKVGQHIIHIPVTSEFSKAAGQELWGYPKIVANVEHNFKQSSLQSKVFDPANNELIMECKGSLGFSIPSPALSLITYSLVEKKLLRTAVKVRGNMKLRLQQNLVLKAGTSDHPMANDLRMLGLNGKKPMIVMDTEKFQSVFYKGAFL